uniref:uncharacterized protein n=1 Tax=Pristiophorus japonicus TaxID=55135 RepID=UPI00398EE977
MSQCKTTEARRSGDTGIIQIPSASSISENEDHGNNFSSSAFYKRSEPYVYVCKSTTSSEEAVMHPFNPRDSLHLSTSDEEWGRTELYVTEGSSTGPPCQRNDHEWVTSCTSDCHNFCKCGSTPPGPLFPDSFLSHASVDLERNRMRNKCYLQRSSLYSIDDQETEAFTRTFRLCNYRGCSKHLNRDAAAKPYLHQPELQPREHSRMKTCKLVEAPGEILKSHQRMKGGCSLFGLGFSKDNDKEQSKWKAERNGECPYRGNRQRDDIYIREQDEIGTSCLSYKTSALCSGALASGEDDLCKSCMKHGKQKDSKSHGQRSARRDIDQGCGYVSSPCIDKRCGKGASNMTTGLNACFCQDCLKVSKCYGVKVPGYAPFLREDTSWLSSATQCRIKESSSSGKRQLRNKCFLQRFQKQDALLRDDSSRHSCSASLSRARGRCRDSSHDQQVGGDGCMRQKDDAYVCEVDDVGTSCLYYKQCPSPCKSRENIVGFSDDDDKNLCEFHKDRCKDGKPQSKANCQRLICKTCKQRAVPGQTFSSCSDDSTSSLLSPRHREYCRGKGASDPIICSLPQWPRHLLLQNSAAQATTTVYKK